MASFSPVLEETIHRALTTASERKHELATLEHLLFALLDDADAQAVIKACDVDLQALRADVQQYLDEDLASLIVEEFEEARPTAGFHRVIQRAVIHVQSSGREEVTGANALVALLEGDIDPLIGRDNEVERCIMVLSRRRKNNPLLVGDPGVGKTAIAEGIARRIVNDDVPDVLADATIYSLDMGALLAGTRYRGDFEERLKAVMERLQELPHAVLFIDDIVNTLKKTALLRAALIKSMSASHLQKMPLKSSKA